MKPLLALINTKSVSVILLLGPGNDGTAGRSMLSRRCRSQQHADGELQDGSRLPHLTSGIPAASAKERFLGRGMMNPSGATAYSAYPPPSSRAYTLSPFLNLVTPLPTSETTPATSSPKIWLAPVTVCANVLMCSEYNTEMSVVLEYSLSTLQTRLGCC